MGLPLPRHPGSTYADYVQWEGRWELIHGEAYAMTPGPSLEHQRLSMRLESAIEDGLEATKKKAGGGECEMFHAPLDVILAEDTVVQPDIVVVCDPAKKTPRGIEGAPDLVVEILSPSTAQRDLKDKRWLYEAHGVAEYLIVDPEDGSGELWRLQEGRYREPLRVAKGDVVKLLGGGLEIAW